MIHFFIYYNKFDKSDNSYKFNMSLELVFGPNKSIITTPHTFKKFNKDITIPSLNPNTNVPSSIFMNDKNYIYEEIEQIFEYLREPFYPSNVS